MAPLKSPSSPLRLVNAPSAPRRLILLDTNIMQYAITSEKGAVIQRLNLELEKLHKSRTTEFGLLMTPFQLLEVLGVSIPNVSVSHEQSKEQSAHQIFDEVTKDAEKKFIDLSVLSQENLKTRASERRSYLPKEAHALFDTCITTPCEQPDLTRQLASLLAWDYGVKHIVSISATRETEQLLATLMITPGRSYLSRFRIAKRFWDLFYSSVHRHIMEKSTSEALQVANKAMRLKTTRDFLDCDIYHIACFGWFESDVTVLTCDPPESILNRVAAYKGMVEAVAAIAPDVPTNRLPMLRAGVIARCDPNGEITQVFPVQAIPTIV